MERFKQGWGVEGEKELTQMKGVWTNQMETYYFVIQLKSIGVKKSARRINHDYLVMLLQYQMLDTFSGIVDLGGP